MQLLKTLKKIPEFQFLKIMSRSLDRLWTCNTGVEGSISLNASFNSNFYYTDNYRIGAGIVVNVSFISRQRERNPKSANNYVF